MNAWASTVFPTSAERVSRTGASPTTFSCAEKANVSEKSTVVVAPRETVADRCWLAKPVRLPRRSYLPGGSAAKR